MKRKTHKLVGILAIVVRAATARCLVVVLCLLASFTNAAMAAAVDYLPIALEQAANPDGPWTTVPVGAQQLAPDGKLLMPAAREHEYWRLKVTAAGDIGFALGLPLIDVPPTPLKIARDFLALHSSPRGEEGQSESEWGSVRLADVATPIYDPALDGGRTPAYMEFKVIAAVGDPSVGDPSVGDSSGYTPAPVRRDRGFIQVSLTENDFPVAAWSTEGTTPIEQLRDAAGTATVKPVMFGPSLLVGESREGRMAATLGSLLSKPHPELMQFADFVGSASYDSETGESNSTPTIPLGQPLDMYASYEQMKEDYQTNEFYVSVRARKRETAKIDWLFARGATFPHLKVGVGDPTINFAGREVRSASLHAPDDARIALLTPLGREGLQIEGLMPGGGVIAVRFAEGEEYFSLEVGDPAAKTAQAMLGGFTPGWKQTKLYLAGTKDNQCWYSQFQSLDFGGGGLGNYVGCGPCAWTMLMGWWDHQGVPVSFRPNASGGSGLPNFKLGLPDAPKSENDSYVNSMMRAFRFQWVDPLYCNIFSGACGTPPDKMAEGTQYFMSLQTPYNLLYEPLLGQKVLGHSYKVSWTWVSYNGVNDHNKLARESIEKGRPSIMGIGFLNHYILAYAYLEKQYEMAPGVFIGWRPYLRANWGNGSAGVKWINFQNDWFFATKARFWQTHMTYNAP